LLMDAEESIVRERSRAFSQANSQRQLTDEAVRRQLELKALAGRRRVSGQDENQKRLLSAAIPIGANRSVIEREPRVALAYLNSGENIWLRGLLNGSTSATADLKAASVVDNEEQHATAENLDVNHRQEADLILERENTASELEVTRRALTEAEAAAAKWRKTAVEARVRIAAMANADRRQAKWKAVEHTTIDLATRRVSMAREAVLQQTVDNLKQAVELGAAALQQADKRTAALRREMEVEREQHRLAAAAAEEQISLLRQKIVVALEAAAEENDIALQKKAVLLQEMQAENAAALQPATTVEEAALQQMDAEKATLAAKQAGSHRLQGVTHIANEPYGQHEGKSVVKTAEEKAQKLVDSALRPSEATVVASDSPLDLPESIVDNGAATIPPEHPQHLSRTTPRFQHLSDQDHKEIAAADMTATDDIRAEPPMVEHIPTVLNTVAWSLAHPYRVVFNWQPREISNKSRVTSEGPPSLLQACHS